MAFVVGTLAQEVDEKVDYVYPKTLASAVEYNAAETVEDKIKKIDQDISDANKRITNIASGIKYGSISTKNDAELIDIRNPNNNLVTNETIYESAGEAIRAQFDILLNMINNMQAEINELKYHNRIVSEL